MSKTLNASSRTCSTRLLMSGTFLNKDKSTLVTAAGRQPLRGNAPERPTNRERRRCAERDGGEGDENAEHGKDGPRRRRTARAV
jgi:hypothetical protein